MAKRKVKEVKVVTPIESVDEVEKTTETLKTLPIIESKEDPITVSEFKEVIGVNSAEKLQKSGWQLIDCHQTPKGMVYKFKKGK